MVCRPHDPVSQIVRRINERERERSLENKNAMKSASLVPVHRKAHMTGPLPEAYANCFQYKLYVGNSSIVSSSKGDNCFQLNGEIVIIRNILHSPLGETFVVYTHFKKCESFFQYPMDSLRLGIYMVSELSDDTHVGLMDDFTKKMVLLPFKDKHVAMPQLHNN